MANREFDKSKGMIFPREVIVGHAVLTKIVKMCDGLPIGNKALIVTGPNTRKIAGDRIADLLSQQGYEIHVSVVEQGASMHEVRKVEQEIKKVKPDFLLSAGGGSIIDVGKFASYRMGLPFISVPTSASHDGIASPRASIKDKKGTKIFHSSKSAVTPLGVLADTELISKAPYRMLAAGCGDAISNLTAVKDWELANRLKNEYLSSYSIALAKTAATIIIESADYIRPNLEESAWIVTKALIVSGVSMSVANSSRPASGAEHMFSHMLDMLVPGKNLHGEQCGVGSIMMMYLHGGDWKLIKNTLQKVGAPTTAKELGVSKDVVVEALTHAHKIKRERYTILGDEGLTKEAAVTLAETTGVI